MKKSTAAAVIILVVLNICFTLWLGYRNTNSKPDMMEDPNLIIAKESITMFVGLGDSKTGKLIGDIDKMEEQVTGILTDDVGGYTVLRAKGGWVDPKRGPLKEDTLVCIFYDTQIDVIKRAADRIKKEVSSGTILIVKSKYSTEYY